ncbi:histidine kinase [Microvirga massiliensis]|uniref:sensor histidine kinase n=1 Tax=Microvirga massiliensis TaxID=1033741 RepID=UPI00066020D4|nr:histidine kinase [Microvirga massiliensis]
MADSAGQRVPVRGDPLRLRRRVALPFAGVVLAACIVAAALLLSNARNERQAIRDRALSTAFTLSFGFDQEVAAGNALLRGLSSSPALKSSDVKAFYDQLKATPIPDGSWLILQDLDGQVVNTLRPFGAPLPRHRDFPTYPDALNRVRERGWTVSGRMASLVKPGTTVIALSLRINHDDGTMKGFLTTVLSQDRLGTILRSQKVPEGWMKGLYDRRLQPIVTTRGAETSSHIPMPGTLAARLTAGNPNEMVEGSIGGVDERGVPVRVAYRSSGATNWTSVVAVPLALVNAPVTGVLRQMAWPAAFLLLAGGLAALFMTRQVERPLRTLAYLVTQARGEVTQLSEQLLALQEEERQRIARELHDSTAQSLVAANLGLARLEREVQQGPAARKTFAQIEALLDRALQELRVFTYLLHPPNLAEDGLKATLEEFIDGFAGRTGLRARIRISDRVDDTPPEVQRAMLRVVQEALANVHRHAGAAEVSVGAKLAGGRLVVRVRDDGRGLERPAGHGSGERTRMGVGIPGMRARLRQFDGDLRIRSGPRGTFLLAHVPLPDAARRAASISLAA